MLLRVIVACCWSAGAADEVMATELVRDVTTAELVDGADFPASFLVSCETK